MAAEITTVLVDSSMFIHLLRQQKDPALELTSRARAMDLATCGMVQVEVLRGVRVPRLRDALRQFMSVMLYAATDFKTWDAVASLAWQLDRKGITLPAQDLIIATCAQRLDAAVLTLDNHFYDIPNLRVIGSLDDLN
jgi:predicted nucleic acid-binding protein